MMQLFIIGFYLIDQGVVVPESFERYSAFCSILLVMICTCDIIELVICLSYDLLVSCQERCTRKEVEEGDKIIGKRQRTRKKRIQHIDTKPVVNVLGKFLAMMASSTGKKVLEKEKRKKTLVSVNTENEEMKGLTQEKVDLDQKKMDEAWNKL